MSETLKCPECGEVVWDLPHGSKLAKCWAVHPSTGGTLAFDTMSDDDDDEEENVTVETRTIQIFKFEELSEESPRAYIGSMSPKDRARDKISQWLHEDANETLNDLFSERLDEYGFPTDTIEWSLGYSQGDGMAFYGSVDVNAFLRKIKQVKRFRTLLSENVDVSADISRNSFGSHYSHWNTMNVDVDYSGVETPKRDALLKELCDVMTEKVQDISRELEQAGYAALEVSDEIIAEHCEANEYRFLVTGEFAPEGESTEKSEPNTAAKARLEELRIELRAERMSYGELAELQGLAEHIDPSDAELLEAAGVPEGDS